MKLAATLAAAVLSMATYSTADAQSAQVSIDNIIADGSISGHVTGLDATTAKGHRVVVYVHTDIWYIHPFAGQGEGRSWASIAANGSWSLSTVKRDFSADEIAVLVVGEGYEFPARTSTVENVKNIGLLRKKLKGTSDFGKL